MSINRGGLTVHLSTLQQDYICLWLAGEARRKSTHFRVQETDSHAILTAHLLWVLQGDGFFCLNVWASVFSHKWWNNCSCLTDDQQFSAQLMFVSLFLFTPMSSDLSKLVLALHYLIVYMAYKNVWLIQYFTMHARELICSRNSREADHQR